MFRVDPQARTRSPPAPAAFPRTKRIIPPPRFANAHAEAMRRVKEDAIRAESLTRDQSTAPSPPASASSDSESDSDNEGDAHHASFAAKPAYVSLFFGWFGATAKQAIPADLQFDTTDADSCKPPNRRCYPPEAVWKAQMAREKAAAAAAQPPRTSRQVFPPAPEPTIRHSSRRSYPPVPDAEAAPPPPPTPPVTSSPTRPTAPPPPPPPRGKRLYKTTSLNRDEMKEQLFRERSERNRRIREEEALRNADEARRRDECGPAQDAEPQRDAAQRQRDKEERRLRERDAQRQRERELRQAEAQRQRDAEADRLRQEEAQRQREAEAERQRQREAERRRQREVEAQRKREADAERARLAAEAERLRRQREAEAEQATQQERWRRLEEQMRNLRENLERAKTEREREERGHKDDPRTQAEEEAARVRERAAEEARRRAQRLRREESAFKRMAGRWDARERHRSAVPLKRTPTPTAALTPRERYDVLWARLLSPIEPDARPFTFATFPWPGGRSLAEIARFLLPAAGGREKHIIRQQLKRWHPDKFAAVAQGRVVDADRQRVLEGQIAVVQALNELLSRF